MALNFSTGAAAALVGSQSFESIFRNGCILVYTGAQPASADAAATGTLLARITPDGDAFEPGVPNGVQFYQSGKYVVRNPTQQWVITPIATGTAGYFRMVGNAPDVNGASFTAVRLDGGVSTLAAPTVGLILPSLSLTSGVTRAVEQFLFHL
jgi:hypothetical protein